MKKLFIILLILVCALLCACGEVLPAETTKAEDAEKTTAKTVTPTVTEEIIYDTEPRRAIVYPLCNIDWIRATTNDFQFYFEKASMEIEYEFPSDWKRVYGSYLSFDDDTFYKDIDAFFLGEESPLSDLPLPEIPAEYVDLVDTIESENLLIRIYEAPFYGQKYYIHGYIRCESYAFGFHMSSKSKKTEVLDIVANTISVTREPDIKRYTEFIATDDNLRSVNIGSLFYAKKRNGNTHSMEYLPWEWNIEVSLPESWTKLKQPQSTAEFTPNQVVYSRYGYPSEGVSPNGCMYQAFCGYNVYVAETAEFYDTNGTTPSGNNYWIDKKELSDYHAIDCNILVQISEDYYYRFSLCVDMNDAELVEKVIDSVKLITKPSIVESSAILLPNLSWVSSYFYRVGTEADIPTANVSFYVPANFKALDNSTFVSLTEEEEFRLSYEFYKTDGIIPLANLPRPTVSFAKLVKSIETPEMIADEYILYDSDDNGGYTIKAVGYGLVDGYAIPFEFSCFDADFDIIPNLLAAISVTEPSDTAIKNEGDVILGEELKSVRISDLFCINRVTMNGNIEEHLPEDCYIELDLPESWELLGKDSAMSNAVYSELGAPGTCLSPERCLYQCFASDCLYTYDTAVAIGASGVTDSGNSYWFDKNTYDYYNAFEYDIYLQVSDEYIYRFTLCVDKDNTDLVEQVINSVVLYTDA